MKKISLILALCVALTFIMSGCKPKEYEPVIAKEYGCFYFPGTDWGMSEDELFKALGKTADNFEESQENLDSSFPITVLKTEKSFMGKKCETYFRFPSLPNGIEAPLSSVSVIYELGDKSYDDFKSELEEFIKAQGIDYGVTKPPKVWEKDAEGNPVVESYSIKAKKWTEELPQEMLDNVNGYWRYIIENDLVDYSHGKTGDEKSEWKRRYLNMDYAKTNSGIISQVDVTYYYNENIANITFNSENFTSFLAMSKAYSQLGK